MRLPDQLITVLKIAFAVGIIAWLVSSGNIDLSVFELIYVPSVFLSCFAIVIFNIALASTRWWLLLRSQELHLTWFRAFQLTLIGLFFNYAMPGGVGGDVVKVVYAVKDFPERKMMAGVSVLMDRVLGLFTMVLMASGALVLSGDLLDLSPELYSLFKINLVLILGFVLAGLALFSSRVLKVFEPLLLRLPKGESLIHFYESAQVFLKHKTSALTVIAISVLTNLSLVAFFMVIASSLGIGDLPVRAYLISVPLGLMVMAIPLSPAGVGVGQAAMLYFFKFFSEESARIGPTALTAFQIVVFFVSLLGAYFFSVEKKKR